MVQDTRHLLVTLAQLRRQLEAGGKLDPDSRALIEVAMADVERILAEQPADELAAKERTHAADLEASSREQSERLESLISRLRQKARQVEESHPTLFGALGSLIDALSRMGI